MVTIAALAAIGGGIVLLLSDTTRPETQPPQPVSEKKV